ncbi:MAG TPA: PQQ-binding-like beta-propeller repeat protein, partial [Terriglobia bacterium]|nr:PQQ-binding-like beta-propeller repeat protein [Terriglobia bacterium]
MIQRTLLGVLVIGAAFFAPVGRPFDTWKSYGGGVDSSQYSSLREINKTNVTQLQVAWTFQPGANTATNPLVVDGVMYVPGGGGITALDAATGKQLWVSPGGTNSRGMNYWESSNRSDRRLIIINQGFIKAINAGTGEPIATFGENGRIDPIAGSDRTIGRPGGNPGRVYKDTIIVSSPASGAGYDATPGDVQAFDILTGKRKWTFHSVPTAGEAGADTWPPEALAAGHGGVHNWSEFTVDEERGMVLVPFGTARYDFYGGNRKGDNLFANSLVALNAETGKRLWHYQMVHHDLWDYDLPTAPKLLTVRNNGRNVDIVAQPTKHGFLFVLNRETGVPLWPVEEKPVPQSDVPGEFTSPTQPFPTLPRPFARQSFTEKDINPFLTPEQKEAVRQRLLNSRNEGLFTPPSMKGSIQLPGHNGGANWGSSAVDPTKGTMYIVSKEIPTYLRVGMRGAGRGGGAGGGAGGGRGGNGRGRGAAAPADGAAPAPTAPQATAPVAAPPAGAAAPAAAAGNRGGAAAPAAGGRGVAAPRAYRPEGFVDYDVPYVFLTSGTTPEGVGGLPEIGPPWSQITAYDLNTGNILWQKPHGGVAVLGEAGKGTGSMAPRGGVVVTAGGLI